MLNWWNTLAEALPPKSKFSTEDIPDLTGRVMVVTGGNTGIGKETIKALLKHNAKVYMASRSKDKAEAAIRDLKEQTGKEAIFLELDLADFASVRKAAEEFLSKERELHVLFNNAGIMWCPKDMLTADGYDMQFGTNVIGPFVFTELLMPALFAGTGTSPDGHARIVTTASSAAYAGAIHWGSFRAGAVRDGLTTKALYAQSKLANIVVAQEIWRRCGDRGIVSLSCNPGNLDSDLTRYMDPLPLKIMRATSLYPVACGALTQLWGGTMPEPLNYNGQYLKPWARLGKSKKEAYDPATGERLWTYLLEQVRLH